MHPANKKVTLIGLHPDLVDYVKYPQITPEKLHNALEADRQQLEQLGCVAQIFYIKDKATAAADVRDFLTANFMDVVLIGAGVRIDPDSFTVFEQVINAVHQAAPQAAICFNTNPTDTAQAVQRWL